MSEETGRKTNQVESFDFEDETIRSPEKKVLCNLKTCPKQWEMLQPKERLLPPPNGFNPDDFERYCGVCERPVYWAESVQEVMVRARAGDCIAVPVDESGAITLLPKRKRILVGSPNFSNYDKWDEEESRYPY